MGEYSIIFIDVLIVGVTGVGKSTIHNEAGGDRPTTAAVDSNPAGCGFTSFDHYFEGQHYRVNLIDTPGIGDAGQNGQRYTDQQIRHQIGTFLQEQNKREINAIFWLVKGDRGDATMAKFYNDLIHGQWRNVVILGRLEHVRKDRSTQVEGAKDSGVAVVNRCVEEGIAHSQPAIALSINKDEELPDSETIVDPAKSSIIRVNGHQQTAVRDFIVKVAKDLPKIRILKDMGLCPGCRKAEGDHQYAAQGECHFEKEMEHPKDCLREERIHSGELNLRHRAQNSGSVKKGDTASKASDICHSFGMIIMPVQPWIGALFGAASVAASCFSSAEECGCGEKDGCEGEWSCCNYYVDVKHSTNQEQNTNGTAKCTSAKVKRYCTIKGCHQTWDIDGDVPPGCVSFCRGPDGASHHEMFRRGTDEPINLCVDINKGGKHLGHKDYLADHPSEA